MLKSTVRVVGLHGRDDNHEFWFAHAGDCSSSHELRSGVPLLILLHLKGGFEGRFAAHSAASLRPFFRGHLNRSLEIEDVHHSGRGRMVTLSALEERHDTPTPRHLKVRIDNALANELSALARRRGVSTSDLVRELLREKLQAERAGLGASATDQALALANLIATENVLKLLERFMPNGAEKSLELADDAADAARVRLERVELSLAEAERDWRR